MADAAPGGGRLVANLMYFARVLRAAGLPVGPGTLLTAVDAVRAVGLGDRRDFYWALHAVFVNRRDQHEIFDQAFHVFWRNPQILEKALAMVLPQTRVETGEEPREMLRRLAEAMHESTGRNRLEQGEDQLEIDAALTFSDREMLQKADFEQMSNAELD
ncbi:MAG: VWA domain-containing protein, partial [Aliidongia sp.]